MMSRGRCHEGAGIWSFEYSNRVHVQTYHNIAGRVLFVHILNQYSFNRLSQLCLSTGIATHCRISVVLNIVVSLFSNTAHYTFNIVFPVRSPSPLDYLFYGFVNASVYIAFARFAVETVIGTSVICSYARILN
ncbi:hypothetical protein B0T12DRAFT_104587 [Alternaria alternata]|nr:hypothetical protein B0T12DRAFT_104587 [Alternaria alternata]